jgi:hypothetical protein
MMLPEIQRLEEQGGHLRPKVEENNTVKRQARRRMATGKKKDPNWKTNKRLLQSSTKP